MPKNIIPMPPTQDPMEALQKARSIGPYNPSPAEISQAVMPLDPSMVGSIGKVIPLIPKSLKSLSSLTKLILQKNGLLGFDSVGQAKSAILQNPDWAARWEVDPIYHPIIEAWKKSHVLSNPPQPTTWEAVKEYVGQAKAYQAQKSAEEIQRVRSTFKVLPKVEP